MIDYFIEFFGEKSLINLFSCENDSPLAAAALRR